MLFKEFTKTKKLLPTLFFRALSFAPSRKVALMETFFHMCSMVVQIVVSDVVITAYLEKSREDNLVPVYVL